MKSVRIRSFSGPYFPAFGLITERYSVSFRIQSECEKKRPKKTLNTDTFHIKANKNPKTFNFLKNGMVLQVIIGCGRVDLD